jgi:hypothetical protein
MNCVSKLPTFIHLEAKPWVMGVPIPEHAILLSFKPTTKYPMILLFQNCYTFLYKSIRKGLSARTTSEKGLHQVELRIIARWGRVNRVTNSGSTDFSHNQ